MRKAYIFYSKYYDFDKSEFTVGGVQTYIDNLCNLCKKLSLETFIVQTGSRQELIKVENKVIIQLECDLAGFEKAVKKNILSKIDIEKDLIIFATDAIIFKTIRFKRSIAIQHGIFWDIPHDNPRSIIRTLISKGRGAYDRIKNFELVSEVVCVDYNFVNWLRTQVEFSTNRFTVIPNFASLAAPTEKPDGVINIIFARRFFKYRGTRLFAEAIAKILEEKDNIFVTCAGAGEDEKWMRNRLAAYPNVRFIKYKNNESLNIHKTQHIAVIPTVGSEGTSLSLLEAMSAQCAVVCTNVGGMTNIVIDGYNGLMVSPSSEEIYWAILRLIENEALRRKLADRAYETVKCAFSIDRWTNSWGKLIERILK